MATVLQILNPKFLVHYHSYLDKYWLKLFDSTKTNHGFIVVVWQKKHYIKKLLCSHVQYANNVDKKYEEKNGIGFVRKCLSKRYR